MKQWHPAPRVMIDDELMRRWTPENPAPDLVVHMVLMAKIHSGDAWGVGKLMRFSGLSKHYARQAISRAEQWVAEWQYPKISSHESAHMHPNPSNGENLGGQISKNMSEKSDNLPSRARLLYTDTAKDTDTVSDMGDTPKPPAPKPKKKNKKKNTITGHGSEEVRAVWDALNKQRQKYRPGARDITLQRSWAATLKDQLKISTPGDIMRAYRYFSEGDGARWWQDNDLDLHSMMTRRTMERMMAESTDWSPEADIQRQRKQIEEAF